MKTIDLTAPGNVLGIIECGTNWWLKLDRAILYAAEDGETEMRVTLPPCDEMNEIPRSIHVSNDALGRDEHEYAANLIGIDGNTVTYEVERIYEN